MKTSSGNVSFFLKNRTAYPGAKTTASVIQSPGQASYNVLAISDPLHVWEGMEGNLLDFVNLKGIMRDMPISDATEGTASTFWKDKPVGGAWTGPPRCGVLGLVPRHLLYFSSFKNIVRPLCLAYYLGASARSA